MALHYILLGFLLKASMTGYEIKEFFNSSTAFFWNADISQIYRELTRMERCGLLKSIIEPQDGRPARKVYTITQAGRDEFTRWLKSSPKKIVETLKSEFCARMFFSDAMDAAEVIREVERFLAEQQKLYATFQHIEAILRDRMPQGLPMALARTRILRMGMGRAKSDIAWAEQTLAELKEQGEKREGDENGNQSFIGR